MEVHKVLSGTQEGMVRAMAGIPVNSEIPDFLLERLSKHKKLLDRVDGRVTAACVAEILLELGFDPDTNSFDGEPTSGKVEVNVDLVESEPVADENEDTAVDETVTDEEPEEPVEPDEPEEPDEDVGPEAKFADGAEVLVMHNGEKVRGTIESHQVIDEDVYYDVTIEEFDIPLTIAEDDIEAIDG